MSAGASPSSRGSRKGARSGSHARSGRSSVASQAGSTCSAWRASSSRWDVACGTAVDGHRTRPHNRSVVDDLQTFVASVDAYEAHIGRYGPALAAALIDVSGIPSGARALDVGCGPGALTTALVGRLGASRVAAIDPSEPFVAACRERHPRADVRLAT